MTEYPTTTELVNAYKRQISCLQTTIVQLLFILVAVFAPLDWQNEELRASTGDRVTCVIDATNEIDFFWLGTDFYKTRPFISVTHEPMLEYISFSEPNVTMNLSIEGKFKRDREYVYVDCRSTNPHSAWNVNSTAWDVKVGKQEHSGHHGFTGFVAHSRVPRSKVVKNNGFSRSIMRKHASWEWSMEYVVTKSQ